MAPVGWYFYFELLYGSLDIIRMDNEVHTARSTGSPRLAAASTSSVVYIKHFV